MYSKESESENRKKQRNHIHAQNYNTSQQRKANHWHDPPRQRPVEFEGELNSVTARTRTEIDLAMEKTIHNCNVHTPVAKTGRSDVVMEKEKRRRREGLLTDRTGQDGRDGKAKQGERRKKGTFSYGWCGWCDELLILSFLGAHR